MKQFLITMAGVFAGLALFVIGIPFLLISAAAGALAPEPLPARMVLSVDLRGPLSDQDGGVASIFRGGSTSVISLVQTLREAEKDDRVKGVFVRLPEGGLTPATAEEIRSAIRHFRASGKPVFAHSQGIYPAGPVASTYMVGAAADAFWMQPDSSFQATGMIGQDLFLKRAFDRYGVEPDFAQRYEYKNAVNAYLQTDYTAAHREATLGWMTSVYTSALNAAAADRKREPAALRALFESGPHLAQEAKAKGLIDETGQVKEAQDALIKAAGGDASLTEIHDYQGRLQVPDLNGRPTIAFVGAEGAIMTGSSDSASPLSGDSTVRSDDIAQALYAAAEDDDVRAIVFRVSSPGGSDTASEQILAAVRSARAAGKPVVVSMGDYAASGGYWISSGADEIVASPGTLTGSIGVFGGKFAIGDALARFGVDARSLQVGGEYAGTGDFSQPFTPAQQAKFETWMDQIYNAFIARVAQGRSMPVERVNEIARGRVWTGEQARSLGLVDHLGGFYVAVDRAKALAKIDGEVRLKRFGGPQSPFEMLGRALGLTAASVRTLAASAWVLGDPAAQGLLDQAMQARLRSGGAHVLADTPL
jgi:protease-4